MVGQRHGDYRVSTDILYVCTGNATRSFLAAAYTAAIRPDLRVESAGTMVVEGTVPSRRTRAAFDEIGLAVPAHTSRQLDETMLDRAQLIVGFEDIHVDYVRRLHPDHVARMILLDQPDPEGADEAEFRATARGIKQSIDRLLQQRAGSPE